MRFIVLIQRIKEVLYPTMEDYQFDLMIGQGTAADLIAYTWREKKPSLNIRVKEQLQLSGVVC